MHPYIKKHVCVPPVPQHFDKGDRLMPPDLLAVPPFPLFPMFIDFCKFWHWHWHWHWHCHSYAATFTVHDIGVDHVQASRNPAGDSVLLRLAAVSVGIVRGEGASAL